MLQSPGSRPSQKEHEVCKAMSPTPGAPLPCLSKAAGWVGVLVAFWEGIFWGCRFCGAWDGACRRCFHFLHEQWQVHGYGELHLPLVCFGGLCVVKLLRVKTVQWTEEGTKEQRIRSGLLPTRAQLRWTRHGGKGTVASMWRSWDRGLHAQQTKVPAEILRPWSLPSCLHGVQKTLDPWPQGTQKQRQTVALCPWLPGWWEMPWKPSQKSLSLPKKAQFGLEIETDTWLTHFTGAKLILNPRPPMAWTEVRTVSQIWTHFLSSICTLYICKPNLSPGTKSALVRASECPGMSWYKEAHWLHWD